MKDTSDYKDGTELGICRFLVVPIMGVQVQLYSGIVVFFLVYFVGISYPPSRGGAGFFGFPFSATCHGYFGRFIFVLIVFSYRHDLELYKDDIQGWKFKAEVPTGNKHES